jgi:uncharacterized protein YjbI with pentapeptide repeats
MDTTIYANPKKWGNSQNVIDLTNESDLNKIPKEVHNSLITGQVRDWRYPASTYKCRFDNALFENVDFDNKDFKDCLFDNCKFLSCKVTFASIVSSTFRNCEFYETPFKDEAIHDCLFRSCIFNKASFVGSMIRNSTIEGCEFLECETSNKVFDACFLRNNKFEKTSLDFRALRDNFGLSHLQISRSNIRADRSYPNDKIFNLNIDEATVANYNLDAIDLWKLEYYKKGDLFFLNPRMDDAFKLEYWLKNIQTPNNFVRFLENFSEFLINEYNNNRCLYYLIVKLHALSYKVYLQISINAEFAAIAQSIAGIHLRTGMILSQVEIEFLNVSFDQVKRLRIRTSADYDNSDISDVISSIRAEDNNFKYSIIQRNSPIDLLFEPTTLTAAKVIISFFVLTKTKVELEKTKLPSKGGEEIQPITSEKSIAIGLANEKTASEFFSLTSSSGGKYKIKISLLVGVSIIKKARKILNVLIKDDQ